MENRITAIILAGGTGLRMGKDIPKQFLELAGKPVISHSIETFQKTGRVTDIVLVCHKDHIELLEKILQGTPADKVRAIVPGGDTRQASSLAGLKNCPEGTEIVLIHDAARPFIDEKIINAVIGAAGESGASGPAIDVEDTIIIEKHGLIAEIPDRRTLKRIQTPQGFKMDVIRAAHEASLQRSVTDSTDDCGMVLSMGHRVKVVKGDRRNIKLTTGKDIVLAETLKGAVSSG